MEKLGDSFDPKELVDNIKDGAEKRALNNAQEKEKIKQEVMFEFNDADSSAFWNKCFNLIPLKTIKILLSNMKSLESEEYHIRNKPAFFINLLKKQGLFPFPGCFIIGVFSYLISPLLTYL